MTTHAVKTGRPDGRLFCDPLAGSHQKRAEGRATRPNGRLAQFDNTFCGAILRRMSNRIAYFSWYFPQRKLTGEPARAR